MASITNWRGISPQHTLSRYRDNFFNDSFRRAWDDDMSFRREGLSVPATNVREREQGFLIELAAPGYQKSDFDIQIQDRTLFISASKENRVTPEDGNSPDEQRNEEKYTRQEFYYQTFSRSFTLPEQAKEEEITARYNNGILFVEVPVEAVENKQETGRKIQVG